MATSIEKVGNLCWLQLGGGTDESRLTLGEVIATAKLEYAWQMLQLAWREKRDEGMISLPSYLAEQVELPVVNNEIDISKLKILKGIPDEQWLMNIGGLTCECQYVKSTINMTQLLCDDDSSGDMKTYVVIGNKIVFPKGTHAKELSIIYANNGEDLNGNITIDDAIGGIVRDRVIEIYRGKTMPEDKTNNSNSNS